MDNSNRLFRKAVIGGFNKDDVIDYIESMKNEFFEYRKQVEETIGELNQKIKELEEAGNVIREPDEPSVSEHLSDDLEPFESEFKNNVSFSVGEINAATDHLKKTADKLCENLTEFMDKISANCISVTVEAPVSQTKNEDKEPEDPVPEFADLVGSDDTDIDKPSASEIAAAYQQAIQIKGSAILSDAFKETDETDDTSAENETSFSQLLDSILSAGQAREKASEEEKKEEENSILDDLLSSSTFFN
ncbi:MAG: hypothetical protein ACI4XE_12210 [Acutalibacteraceae bacterium]